MNFIPSWSISVLLLIFAALVLSGLVSLIIGPAMQSSHTCLSCIKGEHWCDDPEWCDCEWCT